MRTLLLLGVVACGSGGGDARSELVAAWKDKGIETAPLEAVTLPALGSDCKSTTVKALEVVLCAYKTPAEATAAAEAALAWVGEATGAAKASKSLVVAVADRRKTEPSGATINQLLKLTPN